MPENLCRMHRDACRRLGPRTALRFKRRGLYHDVSWSEYRRQADRAAAGLIALGIQAGDRVALLAENRYEWLVADHAIMSAGGINVPLHAPLTPQQVQYQFDHSGSRGVIVSNEHQASKIRQILDDLPNLEFLVSFDPVDAVPRLRQLTWDGLAQRGHDAGADGLDEISRREAVLAQDEPATIIYTSGTTGPPKGVVLTHGNLLSNAAATREVSGIGTDDVLLSWLPYSHIYARTVDHYVTTLAESTVALAESFETLLDNLAEIQPTWLTAVPRFYEKVWNAVAPRPAEERGKTLQRMFGPRLKQLTSGGAALPRHVCEGFFEAGIPLLEGYGLTESSPVISFNSRDACRIGTVGRPIPGVEVTIAEDGEILTRGPHVMQEYWKNPEATAQTIVDGWLHTGDVGELDADGFLAITDRKKDLIVTSTGKNVAPGELEQLLTADPLIEQAVVYGDGRPFPTALVVPDIDKLDETAHELGVDVETEGEFVSEPELLAFFQDRIDACMRNVSRPEQVRKFLLLARPFRLDEDELTATLKVRRRHVIEKYADHLAALYEDAS